MIRLTSVFNRPLSLMHANLNTRQFYQCQRALKEAQKLHQDGFDKDALFVLRPAIKILENLHSPMRLQCLLYDLQAECFLKLNKIERARNSIELCLFNARQIHDEQLVSEIEQKWKSLLHDGTVEAENQ